MKSLRGKRALITGAGSGIGRALALEFSRCGADVMLVDIDSARLAAIVQQVELAGVEAVPLRCDLSRPEEVNDCVAAALGVWSAFDLLVNNAGVAYYGPTENMAADQWDWLLQINLLTPLQLTREFLPHLLARPEAHIVNVCSIAGLVAGRKLAAYHASKFALVGFSESLRAEYARRGLGVTAVCPGFVRTKMFADAVSGNPRRAVREPPRWLTISPETVARRTVGAIRKNQGLVLVSPMAHLLYFLKRLSPTLLDSLNGFNRKSWRCRKSNPRPAPPRPRAVAPRALSLID
jgi:short-subunit dehydrogenase